LPSAGAATFAIVVPAGLPTESRRGLAEIKRMYIRPRSRGQGVGRALLAALEQAAADLGADTVRLDTGAKQPLAEGMYERSGYRKIGNWNDNPHASYWGEKRPH
jgi:GNAT superfamily N-acetyltransferase